MSEDTTKAASKPGWKSRGIQGTSVAAAISIFMVVSNIMGKDIDQAEVTGLVDTGWELYGMIAVFLASVWGFIGRWNGKKSPSPISGIFGR
ncbi:MAG: hypothetical protein ACR2QC_02490 [Gammaproteobacteria bacterium]